MGAWKIPAVKTVILEPPDQGIDPLCFAMAVDVNNDGIDCQQGIVIVLEKTQSQVVKSRYELSNKIQRTNNRISQGRAYVRRNKSGVQSINLNNTEMGKAIKREGGLKAEKAHAETQENRSR